MAIFCKADKAVSKKTTPMAAFTNTSGPRYVSLTGRSGRPRLAALVGADRQLWAEFYGAVGCELPKAACKWRGCVAEGPAVI